MYNPFYLILSVLPNTIIKISGESSCHVQFKGYKKMTSNPCISHLRICFSFFHAPKPWINHLNFYCIKQMDKIFPCVCTVIDHWRRQRVKNIRKLKARKGVHKKIITTTKKKNCAILHEWAHSISNHVYWCAANSEGDRDLLKAKWLSIVISCLVWILFVLTGH